MKKKVDEGAGFSFKKFDKVLIVLILLIIGFVVYLQLFYVGECQNFECFKSKMESCDKVEYVNEAPEASWHYRIRGMEGDSCKIDVEVLLAKKGELGIDRLVGKDMKCFYPEGVATYPEKDLSVCHGELKEELQEIIINKLHTYVIENLGQIDKELNSFL